MSLLLVYALLAVGATWPLAAEPDTRLPLGTLDHATVTLHLVWTLWWTSDRLAAGFADYWDAPIFFPNPGSFALSEPMPLLGLLAAPLFRLGLPPVGIANALLLAMLALNGWIGFFLLRRIGLEHRAAALGGAFLVALPYSHREIGVLHLVPLAGVLGTLWAGLAWIERPTTARALALGAALAATYLICGQHALILALVAPPAFLWWLRRPALAPRALLGLAAGALLCAGLIAPVVSAQLEARRLHRIERPLHIAQAGAALPRDFWAAPWPALLPVPGGLEPRRSDRLGLHPGSAKLGLALVGLVLGLGMRLRRRAVAFAATLLGVSVLLAMLPALVDEALFAKLRSLLPGLSQLRSFYRAALLTQIGVVLLAALGLDLLFSQARALAERRPRAARAATAAALALGAIAVFDLWPRAQNFARAPSLETWAPWTGWVRANVGPDEAMIYLPMPKTGRMRGFEEDARWMLLQTAHGRPMVNGYSGFLPQSLRHVASEMRHFPQPRSHRALQEEDVRWLVARPSWLQRLPTRTLDPRLWRAAYRDDALDVAVYEVLANAP